MKHFVITPFYPYAKKPLNNEILFSKGCDLLDVGLIHLKAYLLPSLNNQTCKDFTLLLGIKNDLSELRPDIHDALLELKDSQSFAMEVLDWYSYYDYITKVGDNEVISTRIDHDDCLGNDAIELIQRRATFKEPFEFFAFMSGAMYWPQEGIVRKYISDTWRDGLSSFSASPTTYCKWNEMRGLPVHGHTRVTSLTDPLGVELKPGINHFLNYEHPLSWLYVRHGWNRSREKWYEYGEELKGLDLKGNFGIDR